ncbi:hypothetical protein L1987_31204 [Smallanthus sonchifolius]|uniref:Uncharacterized protein n=1 Tax=Smallanthus sonchifolius TaxID=185202 RepID=A0ACB9I692_9ASTR|nr:hypothetical protein L1987_31204 [Smallanthus sonchifolius]
MGSVVPQFLLIGIVLFNFLDNVNAGVTSSFIRSEWPSVDIPLDNEAFAVPSGYNAPEQVHITQGDYDGKAVIIIWVTPVEPGSNQVKYGKTEKKYDFTAEGTVKSYTFYNYTSGYIHECLINDLEYRISNIHYNVTSGASYPVPDKSAPVYITVGDGGNQEGLASR